MMLIPVTALLVALAVLPSFAQGPALSPELELKRQILILQTQLTDAQDRIAKLTSAYGQCLQTTVPKLEPLFAQFKADVEAANPGFTYDVATGVFSPRSKAP